jgi:hypothetical protein
MSTKRSFRPDSIATLEDRAVPSGFGFHFEGGGDFGGRGGQGGLGGLIASIPAQDAQLVRQAFQQFDQTYLTDVRTILLPSGTTDPSANRAAFDTAVGTALGDLNTAIDSAIGNLPNAATLEAEIEAELLGTASTSLQSELAAIPTPTAVTFSTTRSFVRSSQGDIGQVAATVTQQVASAPLPTGAITTATVQTDLQAIRSAFQTFSQSYNTAVKTTLLASGTTPTANRAAFDTAVGTALTTLNTSITSALSNLPTSVATSLTTTIQNDLLTGTQTAGTDLQARLTALKTPTTTRGFGTWFFRLGSSLNIGFAQGQVIHDLAVAVNAYNSAL